MSAYAIRHGAGSARCGRGDPDRLAALWRAMSGAYGGAHRGRLRVGVDHIRHGLVVGLAGLAENVRGDDLALVLADMGEQPHAGDVPNGP